VSRVADGATTRRERILEMLGYIRGFQPRGVPQNQVQLHMSMAHGLTFRKTQEYIYEMEMGGVLLFEGGKLKMNIDNFRRLMALMAPDRNPETGEKIKFGLVLENMETGLGEPPG